MSEGFFPTWATQTMSQRQESKAFAKHMLRFQRHDALQNNQGLYPELVLINLHDGLSSYRLMAGLFRFVCGNGMIAGQAYNEIRIKHKGDVIGNVIEGKVRQLTKGNRGISLFRDMDSWIRRRLRCYRLKQRKRKWPIATWLMKLGVSRQNAWRLAKSDKSWWRKSHNPIINTAMPNEWFETLGLFSLYEKAKALKA